MTVLTLATDLAVVACYGIVGVLLMALGYVLIDLVTPGSLRDLIWVQRNRNAALLLTSGLLGVATIVVAAIAGSHDDFGTGLLSAIGYGAVGLVLMAVAFLLVDLATPGRLGEILVEPEPHPAVWISCVVHVALGGIIAAAIL